MIVRCDYEIAIDGIATPEQVMTAFLTVSERAVILSEEIDGSEDYVILINSQTVSIVSESE